MKTARKKSSCFYFCSTCKSKNCIEINNIEHRGIISSQCKFCGNKNTVFNYSVLLRRGITRGLFENE